MEVVPDALKREDSVIHSPVKTKEDAEKDGTVSSVNVLKDTWAMTAVSPLMMSKVLEGMDFSS